MQRITLTFEPDGSFEVDMNGFHGKGCDKLLDELTQGDQTIDRRKKPEFYQQEKQVEKARS